MEMSHFSAMAKKPKGPLGYTSDIFRFDVAAQYTFEMGDSELDLSLDIFNLFNLQKPTEVNESESSGA